MGVPKFFRWISERYPAISQLIAENHIPEFDCLYLDMNGIIHNCTHNDSDSPTFRMTEDKMFIAIFNYIEHLFGKIKPQKLFFMAIDGVAPRAKMNQQRARRFRTALDVENARNKAILEGVEMPKEAAFDSNCITPGTEFMARLTKHLKYFINKKVSEDADWQGVEIVLSGHEVPGEGEHKIMEYIRQAKSQPNYDPNRRHCLYGLDADLIMLGLLSHDPHFALLREEVNFGRGNQKKSKELEHQNFFLLHLCLVREYLELEFQELNEPGALSFAFDMERVIDDFILMAFFVGNDFLPNLPHLHINEGALALMFGIYKTVLRKVDGYVNEGGVINLKRLEVLLDELAHVEYRFFESDNADASWFKGKRLEREDVMQRTKRRGQLTVTTEQRAIFRKIRTFISSRSGNPNGAFDLPVSLPARDRKFIEELADAMHLQWKTVENDAGDRHLRLSFPPRRLDGDDEDGETEDDDEEAQSALLRVMKRYENAQVVDVSAEQAQEMMEKKYQEKFMAWKDMHYNSKFGWGMSNEEEMRKLTENYVQGLQWVLFYYYRGVASWPWFYGYHYSPMISDVKKGLGANMNFNLGQPFRPYQQLMGVLPDRSKSIVPTPYWDLMTNPASPIIDFYPRDFELDINGKKQDWEAVVKIPFIQEDRLLAAMATKDMDLTQDEKARNEFGVSLSFTYKPDLDYIYPSSLPGIFPDIPHCHCVENIFELPTMDGLDVYVGLMDGVFIGAESLAGFPSLKTLPFNGALGFHGVNIFQQDSRNESMVVTLTGAEENAVVAKAIPRLGKSIFVGYPYLFEAKVVKVSDEMFDYVLSSDGSAQPMQIPHDARGIDDFRRKAERIEKTYSKRFGMIIGSVESLVHVDVLKGLQKQDSGATLKEYARIEGIDIDYATQTVVYAVHSEDPRFIEKPALPVQEEFPVGSRGFYLGDDAYGRPSEVIGHAGETVSVWMSRLKEHEPEFGRQVVAAVERNSPYTPSYAVARLLHINPLVLSKLTASFQVMSGSLKLNLGLNLKFEAKKLKVLGYSRRGNSGWEFSQKAIDLISQYMIKFPDFIAGIIRNPKGDVYNDTDFYPKDIATAKMKEIGQWLKSIETKTFQKVPLDAQQLDSEAVERIEQAADFNLANGPASETVDVNGVPRHALLKPADAEHRVGSQRFNLGDRIVYVAEVGKVPIGQRGTVIGITRTTRLTWLDVVFDTTFMSGTSLDHRCSEFRGSTVPHTAVLNLTDCQVVWSQAGLTRSQARNSQAHVQQRGYGAPVGIGGPGRLIPAPTPQPLRGSFRGALGGQNGGATRGRGRGGTGQSFNLFAPFSIPVRGGPANVAHPRGGGLPVGSANGAQTTTTNGFSTVRGNRGGRGGAANRGGYTVTDTSDPTAGVVQQNPNFRPQNYSSVPPPASLDANRGGRGRGRGVARGGANGRARG